MNSFYNDYIILSDTELLLHSSIDFEKEIHKKNGLNKKYLHENHKKIKIMKKKMNLSIKTVGRKIKLRMIFL